MLNVNVSWYHLHFINKVVMVRWMDTSHTELFWICTLEWLLGIETVGLLKYILEPVLLTWINFNLSMDEWYKLSKMWDEITYPYPNFNSWTG